MSTQEWFRNKDWNEHIEENFFSRLSRSRSQRDQYLAIQALTIAKAKPEIALKLIDLYFTSKKTDFDDIRVLSAKAEAYLALKETEKAVLAMKDVLSIERKKPNQKTTIYVDYPYLVATKKIVAEYKPALSSLEERASDLRFPLDIFKWHASKSLITHELGEKVVAKMHAGLALEAAQIKKSGFRFHQKLGLVGKDHETTVEQLRNIYA